MNCKKVEVQKNDPLLLKLDAQLQVLCYYELENL